MYNTTGFRPDQGLQTTACEDISSGSRRHFVNNEKIMYFQKMY